MARFDAAIDFESGMYSTGHSYASSANSKNEDPLMTAIHTLEEKVESYYHSYKRVLPFASRLFLVMTFLEDGMRMYIGWNDQVSFFTGSSWRWSASMAHTFIFFNMVMQLSGAVAVLSGRALAIDIGAAVLALNVVMQQVIYTPLHSWAYLSQGLAMLGSLSMVMLEATHSGSRATRFDFGFSAPEDTKKEKAKPYMQLVGRVLIVLMFLTITAKSEMSAVRVMLGCVNFALVLAVAVGYRTRMAAFVLVCNLVITNQIMNNFWSVPRWRADAVRFDYFQTMSVIGGLLSVVSLGAGDLSVDSKKKK